MYLDVSSGASPFSSNKHPKYLANKNPASFPDGSMSPKSSSLALRTVPYFKLAEVPIICSHFLGTSIKVSERSKPHLLDKVITVQATIILVRLAISLHSLILTPYFSPLLLITHQHRAEIRGSPGENELFDRTSDLGLIYLLAYFRPFCTIIELYCAASCLVNRTGLILSIDGFSFCFHIGGRFGLFWELVTREANILSCVSFRYVEQSTIGC